MARMVRAAQVVAHGAPLVVQDVALAEPGPGQVVVEMSFAGVNPVDRYAALGRVGADAPLPRTIGVEGSGTLDGRPVAMHASGLWSTAAVVDAATVVPVPDGVSLEQAAALGVAGVTAWQTVFEVADVTSADRVLVLGASGGVGSMITSLLRSTGAVVWGQTSTAAKASRVMEHGASSAVVADAANLATSVSELRPTVVFDPLGGGFTGGALEAMAQGGRLVLFGTSAGATGEVPLQLIYRKAITIHGYGSLIAGPAKVREGLAAALQAVADGRLAVAIDAVLPLDEVNQAFERLAERRVDGKLVLDLRG